MKTCIIEAVNTVGKGFVCAILQVNPGGVGSGSGQIHGFAHPAHRDTGPDFGDDLQPQIDGRVFGCIVRGGVFIEMPHGFHQRIDAFLAGRKVFFEK